MALAIQNGLSNKYVSERHHYASQEKLTAGGASKKLKKEGINLSAKETVEAFKLLNNCETEWHHAGFYKNNGKSTMGRTFFFSEEEINEIKERFAEIEVAKKQQEMEKERKSETQIFGFYYNWTHDYSGNYGKKRNHKILAIYRGSELNKPKNFTLLISEKEFEKAKAKAKEGKKYYGWDEPDISEFS